MRRTATLAAAALVLTAGLVTVPPAAACGCGGVVTDGTDVEIAGERAVISLVDGVERVQIALDAISGAPDAALVVPTPTPATAALGDAEVFDALEDVVAPQPEEVSVWWPDLGAGADAGAPQVGADSPVAVFQEVRLGPLEVASLGSGDLDALLDWLDERGYALSPGLEEHMGAYVEEGWSFVAIRLAPEEQALDGAIPPVELTFEADALVYPMRLSAAAATAQQVTTFVVGDGRIDRTDGQAGGATTLFAGALDAAAWPALAGWAEPFGDGAYVTAEEQRFPDPALEISEDFTFEPSTEPDLVRTYQVEVDRMVGPIHAGPAFVILGVLAVGVTSALLFRGRRRRAGRV